VRCAPVGFMIPFGATEPQAAAPARWAPDRGCQVSPSCLRCPLPRCIDELARAERALVLATLGHAGKTPARVSIPGR